MSRSQKTTDYGRGGAREKVRTTLRWDDGVNEFVKTCFGDKRILPYAIVLGQSSADKLVSTVANERWVHSHTGGVHVQQYQRANDGISNDAMSKRQRFRYMPNIHD